jgi:hypothetical protein
MARNLFGVEKGIRVFGENGDSALADFLFGTLAPTGTGDQASAPIGSIYVRSGVGEIYQKIANAGNSTDWQLNGSSSAVIGKWRNEKVKAVTNDAVVAGVRDLVANPFSDDQAPLLTAADFVVGEFIIANAGAAPVLLEVTAVSAPNVTFAAAANPLVAEDTFVAINYLPDSPADQEDRAIVNYNGSVMVKLADVNWNFADGINMAAGYAAQNGTISSADSVNSAIQKLDGNQQDIQTTLGVAQGSVNLGSWTSPVDLIFSATATIKSLFQRIGDLLAQLRGVEVNAVTAIATVDQVPTSTVKACKWLVTAFEEATPANLKAMEVYAANNGALVDDTIYAKISVGANFNLRLSVDVSGGQMRLRAQSSTAGVTVIARRIEVLKTVL